MGDVIGGKVLLKEGGFEDKGSTLEVGGESEDLGRAKELLGLIKAAVDRMG